MEQALELHQTAQLTEDTAADSALRVSRSAFPNGLSRREVEVLCLIAAGRSNREIADELVLSVRTVERHIGSIYAKIGATGEGARAAAATYAVTHSLTQPA